MSIDVDSIMSRLATERKKQANSIMELALDQTFDKQGDLREDTLENAMKLLSSGVQHYPENADLHKQLALTMYYQGDEKGAKNYMRMVTELQPENKEFHIARAFFLAEIFAPEHEIVNAQNAAYRLDLSNEQKIALNDLTIRLHSPFPYL